MSSIILSAAGSKAGSALGFALGGPIGGLIGSVVGSQAASSIGSRLDDAVFGPISLPTRNGPLLADLSVQTSTYRKMIPIVYGKVRIAGNIL